MKNLDELRSEIDSIDSEIVKLLETRMELVHEVAQYKLQHNIPILNSARETEVVNRNLTFVKDEKKSKFIEEFIIFVMQISREYQAQVHSSDKKSLE